MVQRPTNYVLYLKLSQSAGIRLATIRTIQKQLVPDSKKVIHLFPFIGAWPNQQQQQQQQ